ncbi:class I SAM-dependent methyltransferase [Nocardia transvalensis]|uniref:class I SAM-dependent methyltransferase n=1 Tax=Nocardia transvalensis TaxID=37333 RepID=UPI0018952301|nr:class I SAM-dependent methyltransferase [Nocardia transvalensis]MBF6327679.1 methyltransferase domain-containing protein [Nocardia transvalensis]
MTDFEAAIAAHYRHDPERDRLQTWGKLELLRTQELIGRYLPAPPAVIYDVGGARGAYALPLARAGYEVHLIDVWEPHVEAAARASEDQRHAPLRSVQVGDARELPFHDRSADGVLLLGPLYHLVDRDERLRALREAHRVLRPGGVLLAAAISRFASTLGGLVTGEITDPDFAAIAAEDVRTGQHRNPHRESRPDWFTDAYFHLPDELHDELKTAGFHDISILAVEGPAGFGVCDDQLDDADRQASVLHAIRRIESAPELLGASAHLMAVARAAG